MSSADGDGSSGKLFRLTVELVTYVLIGSAVLVGMRIADWVIPKPETRVLFCFASDVAVVEPCMTAAEILRANAKKGD